MVSVIEQPVFTSEFQALEQLTQFNRRSQFPHLQNEGGTTSQICEEGNQCLLVPYK